MAAEFLEPGVVRAENCALKGFIGDAVKLAHCAGEKNFGRDSIDILVAQTGGGFPTAGIIFVTEILIKTNRLKMLFLLDFRDAVVLADHQAFRIVR